MLANNGVHHHGSISELRVTDNTKDRVASKECAQLITYGSFDLRHDYRHLDILELVGIATLVSLLSFPVSFSQVFLPHVTTVGFEKLLTNVPLLVE
ncbi:hypothetical protein D3C78_975250 [compost metagenome]